MLIKAKFSIKIYIYKKTKFLWNWSSSVKKKKRKKIELHYFHVLSLTIKVAFPWKGKTHRLLALCTLTGYIKCFIQLICLSIYKKQLLRWIIEVCKNGLLFKFIFESEWLKNTVCCCLKIYMCIELSMISWFLLDVYSYDEDDMVLDSKLAEHLTHFGIDMMTMEKVSHYHMLALFNYDSVWVGR